MPTAAKYVELIAAKTVQQLEFPYGPGTPILFETKIPTKGYSEIRVWVWVFANNYKTAPFKSSSKLNVTLCHAFPNASIDYAKGTIKTSVTSELYGYLREPIIGETIRIVGEAQHFPAGPYTVSVTCYLVP